MFGWISAAAALGFAAGGVVGVHVHNDDADQWNQSCRTKVGDATCDDLHERGTRAQTLGIASFVLAGALGATAAILFLTAHEPGPGVEGRVACLPDLGRVGATCALRF
jgi:hypothetical protein